MRVAVVGGGIAGLAAAWELATSGAEVAVYEPGHLGGKLLTSEFLGRPVDEGPDALLARVPDGTGLCREVGLGDELVAPASSKALLWSDGKLRPFPDGLVLGAPARLVPLARSRVLSLGGMARALGDLVLPRTQLGSDESVFNVVAARFGAEVAAKLVDPLVGSIYAGPTMGLSAATTAPQLLGAAKAKRSLLAGLRQAATQAGAANGAAGSGSGAAFMAPKGGMQSLSDQLVQRLQAPEMGTTFFPMQVTALHVDGARVVVLPDEEHYDGAVVAVPAYAAIPLLEPLLAATGTSGAGVAAELAPSLFASVAIVTVGLRGDELPVPPGHSGALVAPGSELVMTACSFGSNKWPHWATAGTEVLRVSVGKAGDERWATMSDEDLVDRVLEELAFVLGGRGAKAPAPLPGGWRVSRWPASLPQYPVGHLDHVAQLRGLLGRAAPHVALAGASFGRVGVPACIASGRQAGAALARSLQGQAEPAA